VPSDARRGLEGTGSEIRDFYSVHQLVKDMPAVRRKLEILNKGTIVLLSAVWEGFCEDVTAEALQLLVDGTPGSVSLPATLRRAIARELEDSPHELAVWDLAGGGWRDVLRARLEYLGEERNRRLNTPKSANIDEFFKRALGIEKMSSHWETPEGSPEQNAVALDAFVELRNDIAHRGLNDIIVTKGVVKKFNNHIQRLAASTESAVEDLVEASTGRRPWNPTTP
jgi:hypothetical protein